MKKSILYVSLFLMATSLSPAMAMFNGDDDDETPPQRTISLQGSYTLTQEDAQEINDILNVDGSLSLHVARDLRIPHGCMISSRGTLDISCRGALINGGIIQAPLLMINTNGLLNNGTFEFGGSHLQNSGG